jgi:hypothetical protein
MTPQIVGGLIVELNGVGQVSHCNLELEFQATPIARLLDFDLSTMFLGGT